MDIKRTARSSHVALPGSLLSRSSTSDGALVKCRSRPPYLFSQPAYSRASLPAHDLVSPQAGEIWFAASVVAGLLLFGLAVFFFVFGALPYWFKVHKHLHEILGCECALRYLRSSPRADGH